LTTVRNRIQRVDLRLRLFDGDSRLQPGDVGGIVAVSRVIRLLFCCERHGCPQGLLVVSRPELRRHHADDRVRAAIEADVATDCGRIATQLSPPESVADDHLELASDLALLIGEGASQLRRYAGDPEK
jgi:hypothetical protein